MKVKALFLVVVLLAGTAAYACEDCKQDPNFPDLGYSCWSGVAVGYTWCYGGGKRTCSKPVGKDCPLKDPIDIRRPQTNDSVTSLASVVNSAASADGSPVDGFTLELE